METDKRILSWDYTYRNLGPRYYEVMNSSFKKQKLHFEQSAKQSLVNKSKYIQLTAAILQYLSLATSCSLL